jgi:hypothetical protein
VRRPDREARPLDALVDPQVRTEELVDPDVLALAEAEKIRRVQ